MIYKQVTFKHYLVSSVTDVQLRSTRLRYHQAYPGNNKFTYAGFDYGDFQCHNFNVLSTGRHLELSEHNGVWHAYERDMLTQSLNTENQLYAVIDRNV